MTPTIFPQVNTSFSPPPGLEEYQCLTIPGFAGQIFEGNMDGARIDVVAWQPSPEDLINLNAGSPVFFSSFGGITPHFLTTEFPVQL